MNEALTLQRLLVLRKLTRAMSEAFRNQIREYLGTIAPVVRPKALFGDYIQGGGKEPARNAERAYTELRESYQKIAGAKPFSLVKELVSPFEIEGVLPELVPMEYAHPAKTGPETKTVAVTTPFRWALAYANYGPARFREILAMRNPPADQVQRFILHYLVVNAIFTRQAGVPKLFEALRYPIDTIRMPEFGELPLTVISAPVSTVRPPDEVIVESTELSGKDVFEEVANLEEVRVLADPVRQQLLTLAGTFGEQV